MDVSGLETALGLGQSLLLIAARAALKLGTDLTGAMALAATRVGMLKAISSPGESGGGNSEYLFFEGFERSESLEFKEPELPLV